MCEWDFHMKTKPVFKKYVLCRKFDFQSEFSHTQPSSKICLSSGCDKKETMLPISSLSVVLAATSGKPVGNVCGG